MFSVERLMTRGSLPWQGYLRDPVSRVIKSKNDQVYGN